MTAAIRAFLRRDAAVAMSYPFPFAADLAGAAFVLLEFLYIGKLVPSGGSVEDYFAFAASGLVVAAVVTTAATSIAAAVRQEQSQGTLEPILAAGLSPRAFAAGIASFPLAIAVVRAAVYLCLAIAFGASFPDASWSLVALAMVLGTVAFGGLGMIAVAVVIVIRQASAAIAWGVGLLTFGAGALFPQELLPAWLTWAARISPVTLTLELVRDGMLDGRGVMDAAGELAVLFAMAISYVLVGLAAVAVGLRWARRIGSVGGY